jgi:hypothetical protein
MSSHLVDDAPTARPGFAKKLGARPDARNARRPAFCSTGFAAPRALPWLRVFSGPQYFQALGRRVIPIPIRREPGNAITPDLWRKGFEFPVLIAL